MTQFPAPTCNQSLQVGKLCIDGYAGHTRGQAERKAVEIEPERPSWAGTCGPDRREGSPLEKLNEDGLTFFDMEGIICIRREDSVTSSA